MLARDQRARDRHKRQEAEANLFAIELLTPRAPLAPYLDGEADLERVLAIADNFDISREAATRRYVSLHEETIAAVFSRKGRMQYAEWASEFPRLQFRKGDVLPALPAPADFLGMSASEEVDAADWLLRPRGAQLVIQTLHQQSGYATTLLRIVPQQTQGNDLLDDVCEIIAQYRTKR